MIRKKQKCPQRPKKKQADDSDSDDFNPFEEPKPELKPLPTWWLSKVLTPMLTTKLDKEVMKSHLQTKRREQEERSVMIREREAMSRQLQERIDELRRQNRAMQEQKCSNEVYAEDEKVDGVLARADGQSKEARQKRELADRLEDEMVELDQIRRLLDRQLETFAPYKRLMDHIVSMTHYKHVESLVDNLQSQLVLREQLCAREKEAEAEAFLQRKEAAAKEALNDTMRLRKMSQVYELRTQLEDLWSERQGWENRWAAIQKTAAEKTIRMAQAKMAMLNLYETIQGEGVDVHDAEEQLDKIQVFILEHDEVLRRIQDEQP